MDTDPKTLIGAINKATQDVSAGHAPANTSNWDAITADRYGATYNDISKKNP